MKLRLKPPSDEPASKDGEPSLLGGRSAAAAKTVSKAEWTKTCFVREDIGFRRCLHVDDALGDPLAVDFGDFERGEGRPLNLHRGRVLLSIDAFSPHLRLKPGPVNVHFVRSEERRVGKECRL